MLHRSYRSFAATHLSVTLLVGLGTAFLVASGGGEETKPSKVPTRPTRAPVRVVGAHILISHVEARRRRPGVTRTKIDARRRAAEALALARRPEVRFIEAIEKFSDEPFAVERAGRLGPGRPVTRVQFRGPFKVLGDALFSMNVGQVSDIVETPAGFHILTRIPIVRYAASHILIQYKGSELAKPSVTRTKEEARKLAGEILSKAREAGADFAALAKANSDDPSRAQGGFLGYFETGQMALEIETALDQMNVGDVVGPLETPLGFHVLLKQKFESAKFHRITASQILIQYRGAKKAKSSMVRTKEKASLLAQRVLSEVNQAGADFAALARKYSDGPEGPEGGSLGAFGRGYTTMPAFEKLAFTLQVGEVAGPVETPYGFHIILRTE